MIVRRLSRRFGEHSWFGVVVDLLVVVVGILVAVQFDGWAQRREDRRIEELYLGRLVEDLQIERGLMDAAERYANERIEAARLLAKFAAEPELAASDPRRIPWAVETVSWRSFPQINEFVYRELQSTGRLALIRSDRLRRKLAEHYTALQHDARVGEELWAQQRFDAASAGLLSIDELEAVERAEGDYDRLSLSPARAVAIMRALALRPAALAELPNLVQHHTFNLRVIDQMRARVDDIVLEIEGERADRRTGR